MRRDTLILTLGALVLLTPYLGVPSSWKTVVLVISGTFIIVVGVFMRQERTMAETQGGRKTDTFMENGHGIVASSSGDTVKADGGRHNDAQKNIYTSQ